MEEFAPMGSNFFPLRFDYFSEVSWSMDFFSVKRLGVQERKQEDTKVVSTIKTKIAGNYKVLRFLVACSWAPGIASSNHISET